MRYAIRVASDENRVPRDTILVSQEGGNLLLSGTVQGREEKIKRKFIKIWVWNSHFAFVINILSGRLL